jgi:hypothetical protein
MALTHNPLFSPFIPFSVEADLDIQFHLIEFTTAVNRRFQ